MAACGAGAAVGAGCASADEGRQRISSWYGAVRELSSLSLAAFSANRLSSHRQRQSLHLAIRQTAPRWDERFEGKRSPRSIDRGRGAQEEQTQHPCSSWDEILHRFARLRDGERSTVFLYAFDLIELKGDDLRRDPPGAPSLRVSRLGSRAGNEFRCGP
jgi:hypothetical protein